MRRSVPAILLSLFSTGDALAAEKIGIILADRANLQHIAFWTARGAGFFEKHGIDLELVVAQEPTDAERLVRHEKGQFAILPPPMYMTLIAANVPIVLVSNLLANDPIDLVVRGEIFDERKLSKTAPLADRLRALKGLKIGVAPHPITRFRALFEAGGLDPKSVVEIVVVPGKEQNEVFGAKKVDALFCHTPFLEKALVDQGAKMLVDISGGEVKSLANKQIHALTVSRAYFDLHPEIVDAMAQAIEDGMKLLRTDQKAAVDALQKAMPDRKRAHLETIAAIYAGAMPKEPAIARDGFEKSLMAFPAGSTQPSLAGIDLSEHIASALRARKR